MLSPLKHRGGQTRAGKERNVKRVLTVVLACALVFGVVLPSGCGGDKKKAREYMNKGDALYQKAVEKASEWETQVKSTSSITDMAAFQEAVGKSKALSSEVLKMSDEAGAEFKKIYNIGGVKDYKEYADIRISEIDILEQILKTMNDTLDKAVALSNSGDRTAFALLYQGATKQLEALSKKGQSLEEEAAKLRLKKEL